MTLRNGALGTTIQSAIAIAVARLSSSPGTRTGNARWKRKLTNNLPTRRSAGSVYLHLHLSFEQCADSSCLQSSLCRNFRRRRVGSRGPAGTDPGSYGDVPSDTTYTPNYPGIAGVADSLRQPNVVFVATGSESTATAITRLRKRQRNHADPKASRSESTTLTSLRKRCSRRQRRCKALALLHHWCIYFSRRPLSMMPEQADSLPPCFANSPWAPQPRATLPLPAPPHILSRDSWLVPICSTDWPNSSRVPQPGAASPLPLSLPPPSLQPLPPPTPNCRITPLRRRGSLRGCGNFRRLRSSLATLGFIVGLFGPWPIRECVRIDKVNNFKPKTKA